MKCYAGNIKTDFAICFACRLDSVKILHQECLLFVVSKFYENFHFLTKKKSGNIDITI